MRPAWYGSLLLATLLVALPAVPARADAPSPTPRPRLPINGVTVDLQRRGFYNAPAHTGEHVERPPFMFHEGHPRPHGEQDPHQTRPHGQHPHHGPHPHRTGNQPRPQPTPTP